MAVLTTGSLVKGLVDGLGGTELTITYVNGNPDKIVTGADVSGLAIDSANGKVYINKIVGGSTWYNLGSKT